MLILGLILPISYIPVVTDIYILTGWIVLSLALPWFFLQPVRLGVAHWLGIAFLGYAALSLIWAPVFQQGIWDLWQLMLLATCFCLGASRDDLSPLWRGLAIGVGINSLLAIGQWFGWHPVYQNNGSFPAGLFFNPDMLGETAALVAIVLYATKQRWQYIALTIPSILLSGGRAALAAIFLVVVAELWRTRSQWRWVALGIPIGAYWINPHVSSLAERWDIWRDTFSGLTWAGHGPGSFFMLYPEFALHTDTMATRPEDPHNDFLGLAFQYGIGAIPLLAILAIGLRAKSQYRLLALAYLAISFVSFPIRIPTEGLIGLAALGHLCRFSPVDGWVGDCWRSTRAAWAFALGRAGIPLEPLYPHKARI